MDTITLTTEMIAVLCIIGFTVFLFISEIVRVDLAAIMIMVLLGGLSYLPGLQNLADVTHLFDGFASNAVISIIAVMIIGAGLDKTGLMSKVASTILKYGGSTEKRIIPVISGTVGFISSFLQNVGAAALFVPVVSRISARTEVPMSRLLMPMGFCAILGGTMTMVGSSPLILLNDLIVTANKDLPSSAQMEPFGLFAVTPVGASLVLTGILYFVLFGRWVLPNKPTRANGASGQSMKEYMKRVYGLKADICEVEIPKGNLLVGEALGDICDAHHLYVIGYYHNGNKVFPPVLTNPIETPCRLAILGRRKVIQEMCDTYGLNLLDKLEVFAEDVAATKSGVAELVIPPDSNIIGTTARERRFRATLGISLLAIHRGEETFSHVETQEHESTRIGTIPFQVGDTLVVHTEWESLTRLKDDKNFVIVTSDYPQEELRPHKVGWALVFFLIALGLILFSDVRLSLCLLVGAVGMITTKVLNIDEAYNAVGWNTVFLLASLIPLGQAVQTTGTAEWIAQQVLFLLDGWPIWGLQVGVAVLATIFTLVMSNVGATVLLVPLAVSIAMAAGGDPAIFALTVAISTSNSFLIPTHQVNALIMGPGGYKVTDFLRTGGMMTILFLIVSMVMMNIVF
ncbi:potassium transporter TrkA [Amylibacter kogurei]|uniref:Potassium transporter TrkA n=1 Tax=Paramylibacter kogurei TaxID=1889778 RepID=A0A2G5K7Z4_9RHOB|nr:SLC13 family permease [Amylibacter kogurei]PIB25661.1 potassium transporter TrkA [Amylibacter kogurei]